MSLDQELLAQIDKYKNIMQKDPNSRDFLRLAELYRKLGVAEEAMKILKEGLKKHPTYVDARLSIARIFLTQGQIEEATEAFEEVIHQDVANFVAYKLLGEIAMQKQEHEKAAERFGAAFRIKPDDQECKVMLDYIGSLLGRDVTPQMGGGTAAPKPPPPPPPPQPSKGTIAVATEEEFGAFEEAEELEEIGEFEEEVSAPFEEAEEFEEVEEGIAEPEGLEEFVESEDVEDATVPESLDEIEDIEEIEDIGEIEEFEEEEVGGVEEIIEEEVFEDMDEFESHLPEEEEFVGEGEEELVAQIFQELSDSKYTSGAEGLIEGSEGELEDLMGLLDSEETAGLSEEYESEVTSEPEPETSAEEADLESMIDQELEGIEGIETFPEEVEEIEEFSAVEEEIEDAGMGVEEFEEIEEFEELVPVDASEEQEEDVTEVVDVSEEGEEQSSIFEDFGLGETEGETAEAESGDVFQNFDFDAFEQELLKDHPPASGGEVLEETGIAEAPVEEVAEEFIEEIVTEEFEELPEEEVEDAFEEGEAIIEEEFVEEEALEEEELPTPSLAEMYIKQDLFDEATNIYRKILEKEPKDQRIRQMLEETLALQAYLEEVG